MSDLTGEKAKHIFAVALVALLLIAVAGIFDGLTIDAPRIEAGSSDNISGYAWSDTIGWISFNCTDLGSCSPNYGVSVDSGSGDLSGYAWSDNIGWITFNQSQLGSCPFAGSCRAWIDGSDNLRGWSRACAGTSSGTCASSTSRTDGWDGWISLNCLDTSSGCGNAYGISLAGTNFSGYAWGDDVVGWIDFSSVLFNGAGPTVSLSANPVSVDVGQSVTLQWTVSDANSCIASSPEDPSLWTGSKSTSGGTDSSVGPVVVDTTFTLSCSNAFDTTIATAPVNINPPDFDITANPTALEMVFSGSGGTSTPTVVSVIPRNYFTGNVTICDEISPCGNTTSISGVSLDYSNVPPVLTQSEYNSGSTVELRSEEPIPSGSHNVTICATDGALPPRCTIVTINVENIVLDIEEF